MFGILKKLRIATKLQIPTIFFVIFLFVLVLIFYQIGHSIDVNKQKKMQYDRFSAHVSEFSNIIKKYFANEIDFASLKRHYQDFNEMKDATDELSHAYKKRFAQLWESINKVEPLFIENKEIEKQIISHTTDSQQKSDIFIDDVIKKLVNPTARSQVSNLERLVIGGAHQNSLSNIKIRELFYKLKDDINQKDGMMKLLDFSIENTKKDIKRLKNTPFAQLPLDAAKNNKTIKTLGLKYISNTEDLMATQKKISQDLDQILIQMNDENAKNSESIFSQIQNKLLSFLIFMSIFAGMLILTQFSVARSITRPIREVVDIAARSCRG